jgi:hypothetical protein
VQNFLRKGTASSDSSATFGLIHSYKYIYNA